MTSPDSCRRVVEADAVFEATVSWSETRVRDDQPHPQFLFTERVVHLRDVRAWRGQPADVIVTGMGDGDCGFEFRVGTRYMIEAYRRPDGQLATSICSSTKPLVWAAGFREYVDSLSRPSRGGHVWGRIVTRQVSADDSFESYHHERDPVEGAIVSVIGPVRRTVTVGLDGLFSVAALPPGDYTISVSLPPGRRDLAAVSPQVVTLDGPYACSELSIGVDYSNRIHGRVVDDTGAPMAGASIDLLPVPRPGHPTSLACVFTDEEGRFELTGLPPGRYAAGVSVAMGPGPMNPFAPVYSRDLEGRSELLIAQEGGAIELQPMVVRRVWARRVLGTITWADGAPAADLRIGAIIVDARGPIPAASPAHTSDDGTFSLVLHEGLRYRLVVRQGRLTIHETEIVVAGEPDQPVTIKLPMKRPG